MTSRTTVSDPFPWLTGDDEMTRRARELDWSTTPMGPVESWPAALRTTFTTTLNCAFPIITWWGPELAFLYNEEYRPSLGAKHPSALGQPGAAIWAEIWDVMGPMLARVMEHGEATRSRDQCLFIERHGYLEETYWSFSYSPIFDESGKIGGVYCPVIETTEKVIAERRLRTLRDLAAECKGSNNEAAAYVSAAKVLAANLHDVPFALIYRIEQKGSVALLEVAAGINAATSAVMLHAGGSSIWSLERAARTGEAVVLSDLSSHFASLSVAPWDTSANSALVLPLMLLGQEHPHAILVAGISRMRALDADYRTFFELVATQIAAALADARGDAQTEMARQRRESEIRYRTLFDSIDEGYCIIRVLFDETGKAFDYSFDEVNQSFARQTGIDNAVGRSMLEIEPNHDAHWFETYGRIVTTGQPERFISEAAALRRWYDVYAFRIGDVGEHRVAVLFHDITEQKNAEAALREADRRKDEFLATLAHELRNPLAPIRNGLHILRSASDLSGTIANVHEMMEGQVNHMVRLVDDLMEVSRITGGKIELRKEQIELAAILLHAVETSRPLIEAAHHRLAITLPDEPLLLDADPVRLAQIIANMLNNAAKYTDEGGQIWLTAYREGSTAILSVRDTGVGIPQDMLPKVFDLFTQVQRTYDRAQGGLGIGLTLVRSLVELHGGQVEATSEGVGTGSEFVVRLPLPRQLAPAVQAPPADRQSTTPPRRILVVDDNRDAGDTLGMILQLLGADIHIARDGPTALEALRSYRPDVVLLDIGLPGMDGYEVARRARQQPESRDVTLIAVTGWGQEEDRRRSREAGIDHHLVKPVDIAALEQLLGTLPVKRQA